MKFKESFERNSIQNEPRLKKFLDAIYTLYMMPRIEGVKVMDLFKNEIGIVDYLDDSILITLKEPNITVGVRELFDNAERIFKRTNPNDEIKVIKSEGYPSHLIPVGTILITLK